LLPQLAQLLGSPLVTLMHEPPQLVWEPPQHTPLLQVVPVAQAWPQVPQLALSDW
jgi:hypothetical protein